MCWRVEERFSLKNILHISNAKHWGIFLKQSLPRLDRKTCAETNCLGTIFRRFGLRSYTPSKNRGSKTFHSLADPRLKYFQRERNFLESSHSKNFFKSLDAGNQITRCKPHNTEAFAFAARNTILNYRRRLFSVNCRSTMHNATDKL